jgi:MFS family permease
MIVAGIGVSLMAIDMSFWSRCREEPAARAPRRATFGQSLRRGFHWLRTSRNYRLFFWVRLGFRFAYLQLAFLVLFGQERLPVAGGAAGVALLGGIMVGILRASGVASSALWGPVADRYGARAVVLASGILLMLAPAMLLTAPLLPAAFALTLPLVPIALNLPVCVFLLALVPLEAGFRAQILGAHRFLVTSAPPERRGSYVGFLSTITSPLTFLPLAGVGLAQVAGVGALFPIAAGGGLVILLAALRMSPHAEADGAADLQAAGDLDER